MQPTVRQVRGLSFQSIINALWRIILDLITRVAQVLGVGVPGSKHVKLSIVSNAMPPGETDGVPPSGIRGDGACSFYAVFLGYVDAYGDTVGFDNFEAFMGLLQTDLDEWLPTGFETGDPRLSDTLEAEKRDMRKELRMVLEGTLNVSQHIAHFYDLMAKSLGITIQLKMMGKDPENPKGPPILLSHEQYNLGKEHTVFLSSNGRHVNLYLTRLPTSELFLGAFQRMWTTPQHPNLGATSFQPGLSSKENWRYSPAK